MRITVHGKQIQTGEALQNHIKERLSDAVGKFLDVPGEATTTISREGSAYRTDILLHLSSGLIAQAHSVGSEVYASTDAAIDKMAKQLRRYKTRLKDHHKRTAHTAPPREAAESFVLATETEEYAGDQDMAGHKSLIIAQTQTDIKTLSVSEAVMHLELSDDPALLFRNGGNGRLNMVYMRRDGNVSWIDPTS